MATETYDNKKNKLYTQKVRELLKELPSCCGSFVRGIESQTSVLTRYGYLVDLRSFFQFLISESSAFQEKKITELTLADLEEIKALDIELFLEHVTLYTKDEREIVNHERAKARKLSTLKSFFKFFYRREMISKNVASLIESPKLHERAIIRLEANEVATLLDTADAGSGLSPTQKRFHKFTKTRDAAILTLFLGTGIRVSELVGINLQDIDFVNNTFLITRKGGNQDALAFGEEVRSALLDYLLQRETMEPLAGHEDAMFLSMQKRRITPRAVENLVKKYASIAAPLKKISPHKLRSTYGTILYHETGDIYLVADVLGHKDVNTTRKHYAALSEDRRRIAAQVVHLRDDENKDVSNVSQEPQEQENKESHDNNNEEKS
ncbi:tyrosine-type recombinase/integrase [Christensenellaceae bacterium OttesenSCG-928-L17]|nr:tyrosine-type recombinase/integrase [Christensenellaceae bacterium OttesenSCG-928-L17]